MKSCRIVVTLSGIHIHINLFFIHIIHINLFLHVLPFSKTKINLVIQHSHNGLITITKVKIYLRLFFQGVVFDLLSAHQIHYIFEVKKRGKFPNA